MPNVLHLFAIRDLKAGTYGQPFAVASRGVATRIFQDMTKNPESFVSRYPADFQLFEIGGFDQDNGVLVPLQMPDYVVCASDLVTSAS